jgi:hypothetical protein
MWNQCACAQVYAIGESPTHLGARRESTISQWWFQQAERSGHLRTTERERIIVLSKGVLNDGPGPDVRNAHLYLGDLEVAGDVEFHQKGSDWYRHGHHLDRAYDNVILHVVNSRAGGPDLPCLEIKVPLVMEQICLAARSPNESELLIAARMRFTKKVQHMDTLAESSHPPFSALALGMLEILAMGPHRSQRLNQIAVQLGWAGWPDAVAWSGSSQSYPQGNKAWSTMEDILANPAPLLSGIKIAGRLIGNADECTRVNPFAAMGLTHSHYMEWVINCLIPHELGLAGFRYWQKLKPFRHYGFERKLCQRLGLDNVPTIAAQQALIWWNGKLCQVRQCQLCPLLR